MNAAPQTLHADVLVIGFGKGGKIAAKTLGRLGRRVVMVEESARMYGGTCPNVGCVPSKGLVHHSRKRRPGTTRRASTSSPSARSRRCARRCAWATSTCSTTSRRSRC